MRYRLRSRVGLWAAIPIGVVLLAIPPAHAGDVSGSRCTITGTQGPDIIWGTPGPDVICGRRGRDIIFGAGGGDVIRGGPGPDIVVAAGGRDVITGGAGNDLLLGGPGADAVRGGSGVNVVSAEPSGQADVQPMDLPSGTAMEKVAVGLQPSIRRMARTFWAMPPEVDSLRVVSGATSGPMLSAAKAWEKLLDRLSAEGSSPSASPALGKDAATDLEVVLEAAISASKLQYERLAAGPSGTSAPTR